MLRKILYLLVLGIVSVSAFGLYIVYYYDAPGPLSQEATVLFKRGEGFVAIVDDLAAQGVIRNPTLFKAIAVALGDARKFKAGEYDFSAAISPRLIMDMIAQGRVVVHKITVAEGLTSREVIDILKDEPALEGAVPDEVAEGSLLPETYHFTRGDDRQALIARMQAGMVSVMAELWDKRAPGLPLNTPGEAITLASIVEKETGLKSERPRVAAVFINRLRRGMKLQTDPTVTYGIEQAKGAPMDRDLVLSDLRAPTPYNTYVIDGLPPGPIANPGRAAIEAVLHPLETKELFFVATGNGGHNFAATLAEHNKNVATYHENLAKAAEPIAPVVAPAPAQPAPTSVATEPVKPADIIVVPDTTKPVEAAASVEPAQPVQAAPAAETATPIKPAESTTQPSETAPVTEPTKPIEPTTPLPAATPAQP